MRYFFIGLAVVVAAGVLDYVLLPDINTKQVVFRIHVVMWVIVGIVIYRCATEATKE